MYLAGYLLNLLLIVALCAIAPRSHVAQTYPVTPCTEAGLDAALAAANDGDTVSFNCGPAIIATQTKVIAKNITLDGLQFSADIMSSRSVPVFRIEAESNVKIVHLRIKGGTTTGSSIDNRGNLTLTDSRVSDSETGIDNHTGASLNVVDTVIVSNEHGLINDGATLIANNVTFADNQSVGLYNSGNATILNSAFTTNTRGIDNGSGILLIANSIFFANRNTRPGEIGSGLANSGSATILNSTFAANYSFGGGAGIGNHRGGTVTLQNTIVTGSNSGWNCFGPIIDKGNNLQFPGTLCGDTISTLDPKLLPLAPYANPARAALLQVNSPAIGTGDMVACKSAAVDNRDQRGAIRISGDDTACDIGAFEFTSADTPTSP